MAKSIQCLSEEETKDLAVEMAQGLRGGEILCLHGELGSGKTAFTAFLAEALGVKERVVSPTFVLLRSYDTQSNAVKKLHHIDAYRLESFADFQGLGLEDLVTDDAVIVIEWAEKVQTWLTEDKCLHINFETLEDTSRRITIL